MFIKTLLLACCCCAPWLVQGQNGTGRERESIQSTLQEFMKDSELQLVLDMEVLTQQFWHFSPQRLREAIRVGDSALYDVLVAELRRLLADSSFSDISIPCLSDVLHFLFDANALVRQNLRANDCFKAADSAKNCTCLAENTRQQSLYHWVTDVLDAMGKVPAGILNGNNFMLGSFSQCNAVAKVKNSQGQLWQGQYCLADVMTTINLLGTPSSPNDKGAKFGGSTDGNRDSGASCFTFMPIARFGLCMPGTCSSHDVQRLTELVLTNNKKSLICKTSITCHQRERNLQKDTAAIVFLWFLLVVVGVLTFGSLFDYFVYQDSLKAVAATDRAHFFRKQSVFAQVMLAFSVYSNGLSILKTDKQSGQIQCIHGIRFFSMLWIILGHTYFYAARRPVTDNVVFLLRQFPKYFSSQFVLNAPLSVDTFFFLSGLLVTFLWMRRAKREKGKHIRSVRFWASFYIHRYLRLTPVYMIVLGLHVTLLDYVTDGPLWEPIEANYCRKSWWTNLIYMNNFLQLNTEMINMLGELRRALSKQDCFHPLTQVGVKVGLWFLTVHHVLELEGLLNFDCMGWTWYLANDMQFYALVPILLILFCKSPRAGTVLSILLALMSAAITLILTMVNDWPPAPTLTSKLDLVRDFKPYWIDLYAKPYARCGPYVAGVLLGYILYRQDVKAQIPKLVAALAWIATGLALFGITFGLHSYSKTGEISDISRVVYALASRLVYAICLCWIVFACTTGYGGPLNWFLSLNIWMPLSRLTFTTYLVHPIVLQAYYLSREIPLHYSSDYQMMCMFLSTTVISYAIAFVTSLAFEAPVCHLENIIKGLTGRRWTAPNNEATNRTEEQLELIGKYPATVGPV